MPQTLLLILAILFLSSCSTYRYFTIDSGDFPKNQRQELVWENDTLSVTYKFRGEGGLMTIAVFNKLNQPLYINWKKSALINDGQFVSLFNKTVIVSGTIETTNYAIDKQWTVGSSRLSASFDLPEGIDFLPPLTGLNNDLIHVADITWKNVLMPEDVRPEKLKNQEGIVTKFNRIYFEYSKSPIRFKTYLTLALGQTADQEFSVQHSFYAKEMIQTTTEPEMFSMYRKDGSQFFVRQTVQ